MRRRAQKPRVTLYPTSLSQSSHCEINDKTDTYKTPEKFLKQIRQCTYDCNQNLPESKELKCAVLSRVVGKLMKSPFYVRDNVSNNKMAQYFYKFGQ